VFSSKFDECVLACISIVILQTIGIIAVRVSPTCARLNPRVSRIGNLDSPQRISKKNTWTSQMLIIRAVRKKNQKVKCR
jgi:hypothetical protein